MLRVGDRQHAREHDVRRRVARMLADRLLAQRLRLIGDGEPMLAIALLRDRAQQLLGALDEAGARARRRAACTRAATAQTTKRRTCTCLSIRRRLTSRRDEPYKRCPWRARSVSASPPAGSPPASLRSRCGSRRCRCAGSTAWSRLLLAAGLALALASYLRGADDRTRRLGVVAFGWNAFGLVLLLVLYVAG